jgi:hypothetical protein
MFIPKSHKVFNNFKNFFVLHFILKFYINLLHKNKFYLKFICKVKGLFTPNMWVSKPIFVDKYYFLGYMLRANISKIATKILTMEKTHCKTFEN